MMIVFKKQNILLMLVFAFLLSIHIGFAEISPTDKTEIQNQVPLIVNSINNNDINSIINTISPTARPALKSEIEQNLAGKMIRFQQSITSYEDLGNNRVKVKGRYSAAGPGWHIDGMSNYYIFEKVGDSWMLVDTDFHQKLGVEYVFKFIIKIFLIILPFIIIFGAFWLWMLIDCARRQFEDKTMWILLILFFNVIGAILYFFTVRKKLIQQEKKQGGNMDAR